MNLSEKFLVAPLPRCEWEGCQNRAVTERCIKVFFGPFRLNLHVSLCSEHLVTDLPPLDYRWVDIEEETKT